MKKNFFIQIKDFCNKYDVSICSGQMQYYHKNIQIIEICFHNYQTYTTTNNIINAQTYLNKIKDISNIQRKRWIIELDESNSDITNIENLEPIQEEENIQFDKRLRKKFFSELRKICKKYDVIIYPGEVILQDIKGNIHQITTVNIEFLNGQTYVPIKTYISSEGQQSYRNISKYEDVIKIGE